MQGRLDRVGSSLQSGRPVRSAKSAEAARANQIGLNLAVYAVQ